MSSSNVSNYSIIFSILLLSQSVSSSSSSSSSSSLIGIACSEAGYINESDHKSCIEMLGSDKKAVSAKNFYDLSVAIIEAGIADAAKTQAYLTEKKESPGIKRVYEECKTSYELVVSGFNDAVTQVKHHADGGSYIVKVVASDYIKPCVTAVESAKVSDETLLHRNENVVIYGISAFVAIEKI